ncbi:hypothetical protein ASD76_08710 [Altererythrobacter sp. Root672]|nr:hypothetical protein ASD76_08710 [Altererythrobacter sp. Root672]
MLGLKEDSPKKLGKHDWLPRVHPDDLPVIEGEFEAAGRRNEIYAARFRAVWPDGSIRHILGVGQAAGTDRTRFVGVNFDLVATARSAVLESCLPSGTMPAFAKAEPVGQRAANENENELRQRALATMTMRQLRNELLNRSTSGELSFDMLLALYMIKATSGILNRGRQAHAARMDSVHEEVGQRLAAISFALGGIEAGAKVADSVTVIRMAVAEAWQELKLHRQEARQEVLP